MTLGQLAARITKLEGKKSQARIGDVREILGILSELCYMGEESMDGGVGNLQTMLYENGKRRLKKAKMI